MTERFDAHVGADIREFRAKLKQVDKTMREVATGVKTSVTANIKDFNRKFALVRTQVTNARFSNATVNIDADIQQATRRFTLLRTQVENARFTTEVNVDADTSRFRRKLAEMRARLLALSRSAVTKLKVDVEFKTSKIKAMFGVLKAGYQDGQAMMSKVATSMRNFGEMVSTSLTGSFMAILPAIAPIFASLGALIGNLGVMIGVLGGQMVAFGLGAVTAFAGFGGVMAMAIGNIKALYEKGAQLNEQQKATKASIDEIKTTYNSLVKDTEKPILKGVSTGAQIVTDLLKQLKPLFMTTSTAFNQLMTTLKQNMKSNAIQDFVAYLNKDGAPIMSNFAKGAGSLLKGLASIFVAFAPLTRSVAKGFENMGASFANWGEGLKSSQKMKDFIAYVQTNMPKISSIFGNAILGTVNFFAAFGGSASGMMTSLQNLMIRWREWTATLSSNQAFQNFLSYVSATAPGVMSLIGNLVTFLVNLGIGMAPLGAKIIEMVNGFLKWTDAMMTNNPVVAQVIAIVLSLTGVVMALLPWVLTIGATFMRIIAPIRQFITSLTSVTSATSFVSTAIQVLSRVFAFLTGPIGIAVAIIATIITVLVKVYQTSATFREQVSTAFNAVKTAIVTAMSSVRAFISQTWSQIKSIWTSNSTEIKTIASHVWNAVKTTITTAMNVIMSIMSVVWPLISGIIKVAWNVIKLVITTAIAIIKGVLSALVKFLTGDFAGGWKALKTMLTTIWNAIKTAGINIFNALKTALSNSFKALKTIIVSVWSSIKSASISAWNSIKSAISSAVNSIKSKVVSTFNAIKSTTSSVVSAIKSVVSSGFNAIKAVVSSVMSGIKSAITSAWNSVKSAVSSAISAIKSVVTSGFSSLVSAVKTAMSNVLSAIKSSWDNAVAFLKGIDLTAIGSHIISGLVNGIKSKAGEVASAVKSIADKVKNGLKSALDIHSPSRETDKIGQHTGQGFANGIAKKKKEAERKAKQLAAAAKKGFTDNLRGLDLKLSAGTISTKTYITQAKSLAKQYSGVVNAQNIVNDKVAKASTKKAVAEQKRKQTLLIAQTKTFNTKLAKLDNAKNSGKISDKTYIKKVQNLAKEYKGIESVQIKADAKVISAQKRVNAEKLANQKANVEKILANESKSAVQQIAYINKIGQTYKKGTAERAYFDAQASKKKEEIYEGLMDLNDKYTKLITESNAQLIASEKALNDEYDKTVASRADALSSFTALFSEVSKTADVTSTQLKNNLQGQVSTLKEWSANINSLMSKGVSGTLLDELRELGPNASAEIAALNTMTTEELAEYQALWNEKSAFANGVAVTELTDLRKTTDEQIKALRAETAVQLKAYKTEWQNEIKTLTGTTKTTFDAMTKSMPAIGKNVITGMQQGLTNMTPALLTQAKSIADAVKKTIQKSLDIHSPSRWGDKMIGQNLVVGIANGINNMTKLAVKSATNLAESVKSELTSGISTIDGLAVSNEMKQSVNKELSVKVKVEVEGNGNNGLTGGVVINNQYDTRNLNESELARQQKRQLQALATNF